MKKNDRKLKQIDEKKLAFVAAAGGGVLPNTHVEDIQGGVA